MKSRRRVNSTVMPLLLREDEKDNGPEGGG
jgi:hypothetical protein